MSSHPSSRKPKLDRRNARKIVDYNPSTSAPSLPSKFLSKANSKSFRVEGYDGKGEIERICEELGLSGGAEALSIPHEEYEAGKAKTGSLERFILDHKSYSLSLDGPSGRLVARRSNDELASSRLASTQFLNPFHSSMSSSSGDSFASDVSLTAGERGLPGPLEMCRDQTSSPLVLSEPLARERPAIRPISTASRAHKDRPNIADAPISVDPNRQDIANAHDIAEGSGTDADVSYHGDRRPSSTMVHGKPFHEARICGRDTFYSPKTSKIAHDFKRLSKSFDQVTLASTESRAGLLPPPPMRLKSDLLLLSTQELLAGFGPDEDMDCNNREMSDDGHTSASSSEDSETDDLEDSTEKQRDFVLNAVLQHSNSAKEQIRPEDGGYSTPQTLEGGASDISIQSWRKLEMIGSGSFGTVYEACSEDGIYFAVKEVSCSGNDSKANQCVKQLEQEIDFLSKFQHENIVRYLGTQKEADKLYIFLEFVTKGSLSSLYQKHPLFDSQIRSYTRQILSGLKYLHERKIMHRDIKCANILVDVSGKVKLADFGLAKQISQLDEEKSCKGSAYWMAPEVIDPRKTYSLPADIWSLGCTVLEMITRRPPFGDLEWHRALWKLGHGEVPPIPESLSDEAKDFLKKCLEVNPLRRPSASQLLKHPFVQYTGGTGLTPRNSITNDLSTLGVITEGKMLSG